MLITPKLGVFPAVIAIAATIPCLTGGPGPAPLARIEIDYPADRSIFPPEITPPTFLWRDEAPNVKSWDFEVEFGDGGPSIRVRADAGHAKLGEIDPRAVSNTNAPPRLSPREAALWSW